MVNTSGLGLSSTQTVNPPVCEHRGEKADMQLAVSLPRIALGCLSPLEKNISSASEQRGDDGTHSGNKMTITFCSYTCSVDCSEIQLLKSVVAYSVDE